MIYLSTAEFYLLLVGWQVPAWHTHTHTHQLCSGIFVIIYMTVFICVCLSAHHDAFDPEPQCSGWADRIPPLHITQLGHGALHVFLRQRRWRIYFHHLVVHITTQDRADSCLGYLLLQVSSENIETQRNVQLSREGWGACYQLLDSPNPRSLRTKTPHFCECFL